MDGTAPIEGHSLHKEKGKQRFPVIPT